MYITEHYAAGRSKGLHTAPQKFFVKCKALSCTIETSHGQNRRSREKHCRRILDTQLPFITAFYGKVFLGQRVARCLLSYAPGEKPIRFYRTSESLCKQGQNSLCLGAGYLEELHAHAHSIKRIRGTWDWIQPIQLGEGKSSQSQPAHFHLFGREYCIMQLMSYCALQILNV